MIEVVTHGGRHEDQDVQLRELLLTNTQIPHFRHFRLLFVISVAGLQIGCHGYDEGVLPQKNR